MQTIRITTSQNIDIDYEIAGLGERIVARLIDYGIFILIVILLLIVGSSVGNINGGIITTALFVVGAVLYVLYDLLCEIFMNGQSIGKRVMKIKVISIDGRQASIGQYLLRWLFRIVDFGLTAGGCALLTAILTQKCQRLGDIVAGTTLIKTHPRAGIGSLAFAPAYDGYKPVFTQVTQLKDKDIILIHEVITNYNKSGNAVIVYNTATQLKKVLGINIPNGMDDLLFLQTIVRDYNHIAAVGEAV
ncbi:MAG: RDD family protein [Mucilaginibacter sp.]